MKLVYATLALSLASSSALGQDQRPVRIGVLSDMSSLFSGNTGAGSVEAVRLAIEEFGPTVLGRPIEVIFADHQNKTDIGAETARRWFENDGVEVVADLANSAVALSVQAIARKANRIALQTASGVTDLSGKACSPLAVQWTWDNYGQAKILANSLPPTSPNSWYILTADYSYGHAIERDLTSLVKATGGTVVGAVRHPINSTDFSSYLLQAQSSGAKTIAIASGGGDAINMVKQAAEFGILQGGQRIVASSLFIPDVHSLGLAIAQGLIITDSFYWDLNDETRAWSKKFFERRKAMPTGFQAGAYSATLHWLKAVKAAGTLEADKVMAEMRKAPVTDMFGRNGFVREDGRMVHDMVVVQVKAPGESKAAWDYYKVLKVVPGKDTVRDLSESDCGLLSTKALP